MSAFSDFLNSAITDHTARLAADKKKFEDEAEQRRKAAADQKLLDESIAAKWQSDQVIINDLVSDYNLRQLEMGSLAKYIPNPNASILNGKVTFAVRGQPLQVFGSIDFIAGPLITVNLNGSPHVSGYDFMKFDRNSYADCFKALLPFIFAHIDETNAQNKRFAAL